MFELSIVFIILKIYHVIDWSWFWVVSPLLFMLILNTIKQSMLQIIKNYPEEFKKGLNKSK